MRYLGGLAGGSWPAAMMADLGNGKFDGASLVLNFESLSPGNTWFRKYYNLYDNVDTETARFLEFEKMVGRLLPDEPRRDPLDRREPVHRQPLRPRRDQRRRRRHLQHAGGALAR